MTKPRNLRTRSDGSATFDDAEFNHVPVPELAASLTTITTPFMHPLGSNIEALISFSSTLVTSMAMEGPDSVDEPGWKWIRQPSSKNATKITPKSLPPDIVGHVADALIRCKQDASVLSLAMLNKASFEVVIPKLWHCVTIVSHMPLGRFFAYIGAYYMTQGQLKSSDPTKAARRAHIASQPPYARSRLYFDSMRHLDIAPLNSTISMGNNEGANDPLQKMMDSAMKGNSRHRLETIRMHHDQTVHNEALWIRIVFTIFEARHIQWKDHSANFLFGQPEAATGLKITNELLRLGLAKWDRTYLESYDVPTWIKQLDLEKFRWTLCEDHLDCLSHSNWYLFALQSAFAKCPKGPWNRKIDGSKDKVKVQEKGPVWLIYDADGDFSEQFENWMWDLTAKAGVAVTPDRWYHIIYEDVLDASGVAWREWVKKDIWSAKATSVGHEGREGESGE